MLGVQEHEVSTIPLFPPHLPVARHNLSGALHCPPQETAAELKHHKLAFLQEAVVVAPHRAEVTKVRLRAAMSSLPFIITR